MNLMNEVIAPIGPQRHKIRVVVFSVWLKLNFCMENNLILERVNILIL